MCTISVRLVTLGNVLITGTNLMALAWDIRMLQFVGREIQLLLRESNN